MRDFGGHKEHNIFKGTLLNYGILKLRGKGVKAMMLLDFEPSSYPPCLACVLDSSS